MLCHQRELVKASNTGQLLLAHDAISARQVTWARKRPDAGLLAAIAEGRAFLVYPLLGEYGHRLDCLEEKEHADECNRLMPLVPDDAVIVLIDATWQQAQKMYNQSPYLHDLPRLELARERPSLFRLRRNQRASGLCTVECAIELLRLAGERQTAGALEAAFLRFMAKPKVLADQCC